MATRERAQPTPGVTTDGYVSIGVIARSHGVKGGLRIHMWNDESDMLRANLEIRLKSERSTTTRKILKVYGPELVMIEGINDRDAADALQGHELLVRRDSFPETDDGEAYLIDLVALPVFDTTGASLGTIEGFTDNGAQPLASIRTPDGRSVLVPFVDGIVVSVEDEPVRRVVLAPPEGLFTLDLEEAANDEQPEEASSEQDVP